MVLLPTLPQEPSNNITVVVTEEATTTEVTQIANGTRGLQRITTATICVNTNEDDERTNAKPELKTN